MTQYENPIPLGDDPSNYGDKAKVQFMLDLRDARRNKGIAIPRFVRALNKAGYTISVTDYKTCEQKPGEAIEHINEWLLEFAARVLNSVRVQNSVQGASTSHAMTVIAERRIARNLDYHQMAELLNSHGITVTEAEYRTAEQGMTKHVSFEIIAECASILRIQAGDILK